MAVQKCLTSIILARVSPKALAPLIKTMRQEIQKPGIAVSNAFVIVEWCSLFMQHVSAETWEQLGNEILFTDADAVEKCLQPGSKSGVTRSTSVVARRGFRKLLSSEDTREKFLTTAITTLTTKASQPTAKHAVILGIIAGVAARQWPLKPILASLKPKYYEFYSREIVGSRTALPEHVASGLGDFFVDFTSLEDVEKDLVPAIEKGLLRAPEVVLGGVLKPLVSSLPESFDLSKVLDGKLLKPLLSNIKSSNPAIRSGAIAAFRAIVAKCSDLKTLDHVVDEIANPLATGKLPAAEQKILHSEMLEVTPLSSQSTTKVLASLSTISAKEGNEAALAAETSALSRAAILALKEGSDLPKPTVDAIVKGLADKKPGSRRIWLLRTGTILHELGAMNATAGLAAFAEGVVPKLIANFQEVTANAAASAQSGLVVGAYILTALNPVLSKQFPDSSITTSLTKASISTQALSLAAKQSFLLNYKVYGKISVEEDLQWLCRALTSVAQSLNDDSDEEVTVAWAEAFIYLISAPSIPPKAQHEAVKSLSKLYVERAELVSQFIIDGLWNSFTLDDAKDKDLKLNTSNLIQVLRSICLDPSELSALGGNVSQETLESQACSILVLARPELIPRSSWIDMCLRMGVDPGTLAKNHTNDLLGEIGQRSSIEQKVSQPTTGLSISVTTILISQF